MVLAAYRRIYTQDYDPSYKALIDNLSTTLNASFTDIYSALGNNITATDNINCTIVQVPVTVDSKGVPTTKTAFNLASYQTTIQGLWVINCTGAQSNSQVLPTAGVFVSYTPSTTTITINNVKGLVANTAYILTIFAIG